MKGRAYPKAKGIIANVSSKTQGGEAGGWEEAELQKERKTGQTEEVAFRKTIPYPAHTHTKKPQNNNNNNNNKKNRLVHSSHTYQPRKYTNFGSGNSTRKGLCGCIDLNNSPPSAPPSLNSPDNSTTTGTFL